MAVEVAEQKTVTCLSENPDLVAVLKRYISVAFIGGFLIWINFEACCLDSGRPPLIDPRSSEPEIKARVFFGLTNASVDGQPRRQECSSCVWPWLFLLFSAHLSQLRWIRSSEPIFLLLIAIQSWTMHKTILSLITWYYVKSSHQLKEIRSDSIHQEWLPPMHDTFTLLLCTTGWISFWDLTQKNHFWETPWEFWSMNPDFLKKL